MKAIIKFDLLKEQSYFDKKQKLGKKYRGRYWINWPLRPNKGIREVYIAENENDIPCFERFVYVWDAKTDAYLGLCGTSWFRNNIALDTAE